MGYATTSNRIGSYEPNENALQEPCIRRALYFPQRNDVYESFTAICLAWKEITEYRYSLIYGYKKQLYPLHLTFSLEDYPHLAGFQYMKDLSLPNYNSSKIVTRMYPFFTSIKADYILSSHYKLDNFIFIIKATAKDELKCDFVCCSIFEKDDQRNYETNQRSRTLLRKERIHIPSGTSTILFNKLFPQ